MGFLERFRSKEEKPSMEERAFAPRKITKCKGVSFWWEDFPRDGWLTQYSNGKREVSCGGLSDNTKGECGNTQKTCIHLSPVSVKKA